MTRRGETQTAAHSCACFLHCRRLPGVSVSLSVSTQHGGTEDTEGTEKGKNRTHIGKFSRSTIRRGTRWQPGSANHSRPFSPHFSSSPCPPCPPCLCVGLK